ncbi:MAG: hypothetical protein WA057_01820, partial [Candidatus Magasanikiibacteriota bacterium]
KHIAYVRQHIKNDEESQFFATRAFELIKKQGVPDKLDKTLVSAIGSEYQKIASEGQGEVGSEEIEVLFEVFKKNPEMNFRLILKEYIKSISLSDSNDRFVIFADNDLQRMAYEQLKLRDNFEKFFKDAPRFRIRMREMLPQLFVDFSPGTKIEDTKELAELVSNQRMLGNKHMIDRWKPVEERIELFLEKARQALQTLNSQKYDEIVASLDDYQMVKQYDKLYRDLKNPSA